MDCVVANWAICDRLTELTVAEYFCVLADAHSWWMSFTLHAQSCTFTAHVSRAIDLSGNRRQLRFVPLYLYEHLISTRPFSELTAIGSDLKSYLR